MSTQTAPAPAVDQQRLARRFIVEITDGITPIQAFYYCMKVAQQGEISGPRDRKQHCYHTTFKNGAEVACVKRGKSERFIVSHKTPNEAPSEQAGGKDSNGH